MSELISNHSVSSFNVTALKEIPKLSSGNLVSWKQGLKIHLKMNGIYCFIKRDIDRPSTYPDHVIFDMKQAAVLHVIWSTVNDANCATIDSMANPKNAYDTLVTQHGANHGFTTANTLTELFSAKYNPSTPMNTYLAEIQDLHSRVCNSTYRNPDLKISDKLFAVVLVNSLPWVKYGTLVKQLPANIKTLSIPQVIACLRLEAVSMACNELRFKEVYAAKITKTDERKIGKGPDDLCHIHPTGRHSNSACFQQQGHKTTANAARQLMLSDYEIIKRYKTIFSQSNSTTEPKPSSKTAAVAALSDWVANEVYVTYLAYSAHSHTVATNSSSFLLDTGANTHRSHDLSLLHDIKTIAPVHINGIAGSIGRLTATKIGSNNIICLTLSEKSWVLEIKNMLLVPNAGLNLLAVSAILSDGG